jgi:hypothetical protein
VSEETLTEKVAKLEATVTEHGRKLIQQEKKNDVITRLVTLFENQERNLQERERKQEERDKKQQEQLDKFSNAMDEVVVNLSNLNNSQVLLGDRVTEIESTLQGQKVDIVKMVKHALGYIGMAILAYVLTKYFGL